MANSKVAPPSEEFAGADFGDARIAGRLIRFATAVAKAPGAGLPEAAGSDGELEGVYRFLRNERVTPARILAPHLARTVERVGERVPLVVHDTTEFGFGGMSQRAGLGRISQEGEKQGFFGHYALAVAGDGSREPLGVVGLQTFVRTGPPTARHRHKRRAGVPTERTRWSELALRVGKTFPRAIHVMDREADSYEIVSELATASARFVIRVCRDRLLHLEGADGKMFAAADRGPICATRSVPLSRRRREADPRNRKIHAPRGERVADLRIRATTHTIKRPHRQALENCPESLTVNMVTVEEVHAPPDAAPVSWRLLTSESVETVEQVEAVVDAYRARWVIEEYFKALKTGCAFEKRQLESLRTLANALAVFSVIAWRLLLLRSVARLRPNALASDAVTERQVQVLHSLAHLDDQGVIPRIDLPSSPTALHALTAVAQLGGHIKNNGSPGWQVLGRGYESLLLIELGWIARGRSDR
jgi:hypothetical protein